jgi:hypothetical protein
MPRSRASGRRKGPRRQPELPYAGYILSPFLNQAHLCAEVELGCQQAAQGSPEYLTPRNFAVLVTDDPQVLERALPGAWLCRAGGFGHFDAAQAAAIDAIVIAKPLVVVR